MSKTSLRQKWADRVQLLGVLRTIGSARAAALGVAMLVVSLLPAATAGATGVLVARVAHADGRLVGLLAPVVVVGVLLVFDLVAQSLLSAVREWVVWQLNGGLRHHVRMMMALPTGAAHLEDKPIRDAAALAISEEILFNLGAAAEGQLWTLTRYLGALGGAALVAMWSIPAAALALAAQVVQRLLFARHLTEDMSSQFAGNARAAGYWREIATGRSGANELRIYGFGDWAVRHFTENQGAYVTFLSQAFRNSLPLMWATMAFCGLGVGVPMAVLTMGAWTGDLSLPHFAAGLGGTVAILQLGMPGPELYAIRSAPPQLGALRRLRELKGDGEVGAPLPLRFERITFERVWFRYAGAAGYVLRDLDLTIQAGEALAIVGGNGAGKTTLLKLLGRFCEPTSGRILIDGVDLSTLDAKRWRERLAIIFQDFMRYELSALDNVALADAADRDARERAQRAAHAAGCLDIVNGLPDGWNTVLSPSLRGGVDLSGGQWQRVALARALYAADRGAWILALDEPTANLDVTAEMSLFANLIEHARGLTSIVVSHRFSTVRRAERIVVLQDGKVVEDGPHDVLVDAGGPYAALYRAQADRYNLGGPDSQAEADENVRRPS